MFCLWQGIDSTPVVRRLVLLEVVIYIIPWGSAESISGYVSAGPSDVSVFEAFEALYGFIVTCKGLIVVKLVVLY
jgi:hypothetical protein